MDKDKKNPKLIKQIIGTTAVVVSTYLVLYGIGAIMSSYKR